MGKTKTDENTDGGLRVTLRLSKEERAYLALRAEADGCTVSQEMRLLMFREDGESVAEKLRATGERDLEMRKVLALEGTRKDFKRIAREYIKTTNFIINGGAISPEILLRKLSSIEQMTVELQRTLNNSLAVLNEKEIHVVSRNLVNVDTKNNEKSIQENAKKLIDFKLNFCFMERVLVMGFLIADAEEYEKNGVKRMRFGIAVERKRKDKKKRIIYTVFSERGDSIDYLKKGRQVFVEGNFDENDKGERLVFATPDTIRLMGGE
jgi:hypothetical protein